MFPYTGISLHMPVYGFRMDRSGSLQVRRHLFPRPEMNLLQKSALVGMLRWAAILPGAVLVAFVAQFPIHWMVLLMTSGVERDSKGKPVLDLSLAALPADVVEYFANALLMPFLLIAVGARIAPRYKLQTGIVLAVLVVGFIGSLVPRIVDDITEGLYTFWRWVRLAITIALLGTSSFWGLY